MERICFYVAVLLFFSFHQTVSGSCSSNLDEKIEVLMNELNGAVSAFENSSTTLISALVNARGYELKKLQEILRTSHFNTSEEATEFLELQKRRVIQCFNSPIGFINSDVQNFRDSEIWIKGMLTDISMGAKNEKCKSPDGIKMQSGLDVANIRIYLEQFVRSVSKKQQVLWNPSIIEAIECSKKKMLESADR